MKRRSLLVSSTLFLASSIVPNAFARADELDVTMQILGDLSDVDRVLASIERERQADEDVRAAGRSRTSPAEERDGSGQHELNRDFLDLKTEVDRDEEGEGELEDYDVPEDVVLDIPDDDEE